MINKLYIINSNTKKVIDEFEGKGIVKIKGSDYCKDNETILIDIVTFGEYFIIRPKYCLDNKTEFNLSFNDAN
jgi:hypothetical protein